MVMPPQAVKVVFLLEFQALIGRHCLQTQAVAERHHLAGLHQVAYNNAALRRSQTCSAQDRGFIPS